MLKTQILEKLQNAGKCRNKKSESIKQPFNTFNTDIFGQHDPGKTPYNSWGKPVRKLLLISGKMLFTVIEIFSKINNQQTDFYNLSRFPCLTTASENVQTTKKEQQ